MFTIAIMHQSLTIAFCNKSVESTAMERSHQSKCAVLPQRVVTAVMAFLGVVVAFLLRQCFSIAITEMVVPLNNTEKRIQSIICTVDTPSTDENDSIPNASGTRYDWTQEQQGWILSSFYIGYFISHVPGAILAQHFGGKSILAIAVFSTMLSNAIIPIGVHYGGLKALIILRVISGLVNGSMYPSVSVLLSAWIPDNERGKLATFVFGGSQVGSLFSAYISGLILAHFPWPIVFYFWSFIAVIWFILFMLICYNDPASHPFISKDELEYLQTEMGKLKRHDNLPLTPWLNIVTSVPILALLCAQMGNDFIFAILSADLPKYMKDVLGFSVENIGFYVSMPYLVMWIVSILSGFTSDYLINGNYLTITQTRKVFAALSGIFPAGCIVAASYAGCNRLLVIIWFTLSHGFMGNYYSSLRVNILDLSPNYAGSIMAVINGMAALSSLGGPIFAGYMVPDSTLEQWRFVFWFAFTISAIRTVIYSIWASAEIQPWNEPNEFNSTETVKLSNVL